MNLYISYSEATAPYGVNHHLRYRTVRMALHPDLPDVSTAVRQEGDMRHYRMVYCQCSDDSRPVHEMIFHHSCLGSSDPDYFFSKSFEEAVKWLLEGEEKSR